METALVWEMPRLFIGRVTCSHDKLYKRECTLYNNPVQDVEGTQPLASVAGRYRNGHHLPHSPLPTPPPVLSIYLSVSLLYWAVVYSHKERKQSLYPFWNPLGPLLHLLYCVYWHKLLHFTLLNGTQSNLYSAFPGVSVLDNILLKFIFRSRKFAEFWPTVATGKPHRYLATLNLITVGSYTSCGIRIQAKPQLSLPAIQMSNSWT